MLRDLRNRVDFFLRSNIRWGRDVDPKQAHEQDAPFQAEFDSYFSIFDWSAALAPLRDRETLTVVDIGCRTFLYAPVLERRFAELGFVTTLHGVELDAFRRFTNLHTRNDYGRFYASQVKDGHYHPIDVLEFNTPVDVVFLLDPFVVSEPLLRWGLPQRTFAPEAIVKHIYGLLRAPCGVLITSNPTDEEFDITKKICTDVGFFSREEKHWEAPDETDSTDRLSVRWSIVP